MRVQHVGPKLADQCVDAAGRCVHLAISEEGPIDRQSPARCAVEEPTVDLLSHHRAPIVPPDWSAEGSPNRGRLAQDRTVRLSVAAVQRRRMVSMCKILNAALALVAIAGL